ncbi:hypothetical protein M2164_000118 [Streptomyces sp. SAI-208]|uniref:hypothetical protein n=1 Tax=Streptomyces sp. SAI-208 TaxID=2940550 RepID=UPI0024759352|nr:hypothetical protein [Streptomyces sp. SAI-208]MDH6604483.1 hypothetical protein [Streptomyces sp. SAI-208]
MTAQPIWAGVGEGEGPLQTRHEDVVDAVPASSFVPLEERAGVVRSEVVLCRSDAGQGPADPGDGDRVRGVVGEVLLDVVVGGGAAQLGDPPQDCLCAGHQRRDQLEQQLVRPLVGEVVGGEVLRTGTWLGGGCVRPGGRDVWPQSVGGLDGGDRLLVGVRLGVDRQPHNRPLP